MSTPTRRGGGFDESYEPPWIRRKSHDLPAYETRPIPPLEPIPLPRVELAPSRRDSRELVPFEGDLAIKELRQQLTLDPDAMPEPLPRPAPTSLRRIAGRWSLAMSLAAVIASAAVVLLQPTSGTRTTADDDVRPALPPGQQSGDAFASARPEDGAGARRLVGEDRRGPVNVALPLGIKLDGAAAGAAIVISGLAAGTRLAPAQADNAGRWQVAAADLGKLEVKPPKDFIGAMDAIVDLKLADGTVADSLVVRLEWTDRAPQARGIPTPAPQPVAAPPPAPQRAIAPDEIAVLVRRGHDFLTTGDIAAARIVFRRAAEAGNAHAALTLGATYDPNVLRQVGAVGIAADATEARRWYKTAEELGSAEAARRLSDLARAGR